MVGTHETFGTLTHLFEFSLTTGIVKAFTVAVVQAEKDAIVIEWTFENIPNPSIQIAPGEGLFLEEVRDTPFTTDFNSFRFPQNA